MEIEINKEYYPVVIYRKKNKNTYIRIDDEKRIVVTTSLFMSDKEVIKILNKNILKISKMLAKKKIVSENSLFFMGVEYNVVAISNMKNITVENGKIYGPSIKKINVWYESEIIKIYTNLLDECYSLFTEKIPYPKLKVRKMKSRWGVCNRRDLSVTLNYHLMKYEKEVIKYVIIHELAHFVYFDHSKKFWNLVEHYCPKYKNYRKILKN